MSGPFGSSQFMYATGAEEGQSLRFEDGDSAYLSFTPASAGNRKTWTWSGWVKRGNITSFSILFGAGTGIILDTNWLGFSSDTLFYSINDGTYAVATSAVFRDPSAWYHLVLSVDTTQATSSNRIKLYINGVQETSLSYSTYPPQNDDSEINSGILHLLGARYRTSIDGHYDGYLANVTFIDGQALDPTSFGEYQDTLWKPKSDTDIQSLTFGTNGFYLPFKQTTEAEGFSTVTYTGNGGTQSIEGVGFEPDFIWGKRRNSTNSHWLVDSVRGAGKRLISNSTVAEDTPSGLQTSFDSSGFTVGSNTECNASGSPYVAWCWDAGSGSPVSNTDGSITSTVKANTTNGFSVVSYTSPNNSSDQTVGHGLSQAPDMIICKNRDSSYNWDIYHSGTGNVEETLTFTTAATRNVDAFTTTAPTSTVFGTKNTYTHNGTDDYIAYCFHSVSGYSKCSSYTGTGAAGNSITGLGFKPAWLMYKRSDSTGNWIIHDNTRDVDDDQNKRLYPNVSNAEGAVSPHDVTFDSDGFTMNTTGGDGNASGGTYIYMAFKDTRDATFFGDTSGNSNNWTPNALNNTDVVPDSPVSGGNFATLNPLATSTATFKEGNLFADLSVNSGAASGTIAVDSGKWYWEVVGNSYSNNGITIGVRSTDNPSSGTYNSDGVFYYANSGAIYVDGSVTDTVASFGVNDIIGVALNVEDDEVSFYKNNTLQITKSLPQSGKTWHPQFGEGTSSGNNSFNVNFGQDSSFAGNETPQGNTDDNGQGDFYYAPPSGFLALTTGNLPTPSITAPDDYFNTVLWTGDDASSRSITGVGFQPDFVWFKARNGAVSHELYDVVRGAGVNKELESNNTNSEGGSNTEIYGYLNSIDADGFSTAAGSDPSFPNVYTNDSRYTYVAWNWLAGGTAVSNTSGSITSQVSANTDAGFSVVSYVGNLTAGATVGHGLTSSAPEMIIIKNRSGAQEWIIYHASKTSTGDLRFDTTTGTSSDKVTGTSSSTFTVAADNAVNSSSGNHIAYCFHSVEGYSKIGSYTGNGSTDGTYVHLGFRASWIMFKRTDSTSTWIIQDAERNQYNVVDKWLDASGSTAEGTLGFLDFTANGFKHRYTSGTWNTSGGTYIFLAFAEAPFKSANAR